MNSQNPQSKLSFLDIIWHYKFQLMLYVVGISFVSFAILYAFGGVPDEFKLVSEKPEIARAQTATTSNPNTPQLRYRPGITTVFKPQGVSNQTQIKGELPQRVIIDKIGLSTFIGNPQSTNIEVLDNELLKGAARYPGSGTLGHGNMFIFGHSTSIKIVNNQAYKAMNGIKNLNPGDIIRFQSATKEYTYKVRSVSLVESDEQYIQLDSKENIATLVTCNVLGEKEERFMVVATYVHSKSL
jgi:LPXTG-site transpeptidase (sortase) family protein